MRDDERYRWGESDHKNTNNENQEIRQHGLTCGFQPAFGHRARDIEADSNRWNENTDPHRKYHNHAVVNDVHSKPVCDRYQQWTKDDERRQSFEQRSDDDEQQDRSENKDSTAVA